jgi:ribosomal protein L12E/L44/L45/RPP1/RPP2
MALPKHMSDGSGRSTSFTDGTWGDASRSYTMSARGLKDKSIEEIIETAKKFAKCARRGRGGASSGATSMDVHDIRANLVDESDSEREQCEFQSSLLT